MGIYIIEVDKSEIVECWNEQAVKEIGYQEYALKKCPEIKVKIYNPSGDCISRSVLDEIWQLYKDYQPHLATEVIEFGDDLEKLINNAQEGERPQYKWEFKKGNGYAKCPVCGHLTTCWSEEELKDYRYCYYCGTKLEGGAE